MMDNPTFVHFRASTTIGIASEIIRLVLARAVLFSEVIIPARVGWPHLMKSTSYPSVIYTAIDAPRLGQGSGFTFSLVRLVAFLAQLGDSIRVRFCIACRLEPLLLKGQDGLYFDSPELFRRVQGSGSRFSALRKVASAVRGFGPVTLREELVQRCKPEMGALGLGPDDWFVCLHVRTSVFHDDSADYRNACFDNYRQAIEYIVKLGGKVVRMGDPGLGIIRYPQAGLIDYPNMIQKSELMDLYLIKHCRFYIGTLSGILDTAYLFQTPTLCVNSLHFDLRSANPCDRVLYKKVARKGSNQILSFGEAMAEYQSILDSDWSLRYELIENSGEEILAATREFIESLLSHRQVSPRQQKVRRVLIRNRLKYAVNHGGGLSMLSASIAFSRCHVVDSSLDNGLLV